MTRIFFDELSKIAPNHNNALKKDLNKLKEDYSLERISNSQYLKHLVELREPLKTA